MTVSASTRRAGPYAGNGVTTSFPFNFKVFDKTGVSVILTPESGNESILVLDSDFSVLLNADQDANPGGTITYPALVGPSPLPATSTLTMIGGMSYDQQTDVTNSGRYLPQVAENAYDKLTILVQQMKEILDRTLQAAVGTTVKLLFPAPSSGKFLRWRSDLTGLENVDAGTDSMALQGLLADAAISVRGTGMLGYIGNFLGAIGRTLLARLSDTISVKDFGAKGDGATDDTVSIQNALNYAVANDCAIYFPKGIYVASSKISATGHVVMRGAGRASTKVRWTSASLTAGFEFTLPLDASFLSKLCDVSCMSLLTQRAGFDTALKIIGATAVAPDRVTPRVVVRDLVIRGATGALVDGWLFGLVLTNCSNAVVDSVSFVGKVNGAEPNYTTDRGISYDNANGASPHPAALAITNCNILYAQNGIYCNDFEGALVSSCQIVGVNVGVRFSGPANYPHASLINSHVNASGTGIIIDQMYEVLVQGTLIYAQNSAATATGIQTINSAGYFSIQGCIFENFNNAVAMNALVVSSGLKGIIGGNIFRRCDSISGAAPGAGIWLTNGSSFCTVTSNHFEETTNPYVDTGNSNNVETGTSSGPVGWATDAQGFTSQWGSQTVLLNGAGQALITLPKTFRAQIHSVLVCNGNSAASGAAVFSVAARTTADISIQVLPNPGAVNVQVEWVARGI